MNFRVFMENSRYSSTGIIKYGPDIRAVVEVDRQLVDYYRSLLPKHIDTRKQMYHPHISFVRKETPPNMQYWGKYDGQAVEFEYNNIIRNDGVYFWIDVYSQRLEEIRKELGLPANRITASTTGPFHITIGNKKNI